MLLDSEFNDGQAGENDKIDFTIDTISAQRNDSLSILDPDADGACSSRRRNELAGQRGCFRFASRRTRRRPPVGGGGQDLMYGEAGNDKLLRRRGNDRLEGATAMTRSTRGCNDTLVGGLGADIMSGGRGVDAVTYAHMTVVSP